MAASVADPIHLSLPDTLEGPRVLLRPYAERDAAAVLASVDESRESLAPWMIWAHADHTVADYVAHIRRWQARWVLREELHLGIFDRHTGRHLGGTGLHRIDWQIRRFEIGYWLRDSAVGHGYATETVQVLTRFAFEVLQANRVEVRMDAHNARSRAVPQRLGFLYEGRLRGAAAGVDGQPRDTEVFAVLPDDYARLVWRTS
ncbi:MAG TPA: GNAT family N-acetyltransferase [Chloroflexota bacterium]|nr:GNAT family N-acetyltransferase [Chloroflexota bacterium]